MEVCIQNLKDKIEQFLDEVEKMEAMYPFIEINKTIEIEAFKEWLVEEVKIEQIRALRDNEIIAQYTNIYI